MKTNMKTSHNHHPFTYLNVVGSMSSTGQESQEATVPPNEEANSTPIPDVDSGARNNTLTDTDADKTLTETENGENIFFHFILVTFITIFCRSRWHRMY